MMNADKGVDFCWDDLLHYIQMRNVIPVTGEGLYWVQHKDKDGNPPGHFLLYPFLAEKFIEEMKLEPPHPNETFAQAVFRYQEQFPHKDINIDIGDDFESFRCGDLQRFLKAHGTEVFISPGNAGLPAELFRKIEANPEKYPGSIIPETQFPAPELFSLLCERVYEKGVGSLTHQAREEILADFYRDILEQLPQSELIIHDVLAPVIFQAKTKRLEER